MEGEVDLVFGDAGDLGAVEKAVGDDVVDLAGSGAEDPGEVGGLVAGEGGGGWGPGVGYETATGHGFSLWEAVLAMGNGNDKKSTFPSGMTTRKATARAKAKAAAKAKATAKANAKATAKANAKATAKANADSLRE